MTIAVIALLAACAALAVVAMLVRSQRHMRIDADERVARALDEMGARMDAISSDLSGTLDRVKSESFQARALSELSSSLDLEEVLDRTVDAAQDLAGADAAIVRVIGRNGYPLVASRGVPPDEAEAYVVSGPPTGTDGRAVGVSFVYRPGADPPGALRSGVAVPLVAEGEEVGFVAVYSHDPIASPSEEAIAKLEALAETAGPAIENARRYSEAQHRAELDDLTGLRNRRTFHESLAREVARARRYNRRLAVLVLDLDDFKTVNDGIGQIAGDRVLQQIADRVRESVRGADIPCRIGGDEFAVVLPESARIDAEGLFARIQATLRRVPCHQAPGLTVSGGIAELAPDEDAILLFERASDALDRAKHAGKGTAA